MAGAIKAAAVAAVAGLVPASAHAAQWSQTAAATYSWHVNTNWDTNPNPYPTGAGITVDVNNDITGNQIVNLPNSTIGLISVGTLNLGDANATNSFTLSSNTLVLDNGANPAAINKTGNGASAVARDSFNAITLRLDSDLVVTANATDSSVANGLIRFQSAINNGINGAKGLTKEGNGLILLNVANGYTGPTIIKGGRINIEGGSNTNVINGNVEIQPGATLRANGAHNVILDTAAMSFTGATNATGSFYNPGFNGTTLISEAIGGLEGTVHATEIGGGVGTFTFGGDNQNRTFNGRFGNTTSYTKAGTGVQTLAGSLHSFQNSVARNFNVLGGRVDLNKDAGVTSIAQSNLNIGDGTQSGASRPAVRLLQSDQIAVRTFTGTPTETTAVTLNSGVFETAGNDEAVGSLALAGSGFNTIDLGTGGSVLNFLAPGTWSATALLEILNWSDASTASGLDQLFIGSSAVLTPEQLAAMSFVNPEGYAPGTYGATQLATGEVVAAVPEPTALALVGLGGITLLGRRTRRN
jgi:autotransporter-associated beta strand protein